MRVDGNHDLSGAGLLSCALMSLAVHDYNWCFVVWTVVLPSSGGVGGRTFTGGLGVPHPVGTSDYMGAS